MTIVKSKFEVTEIKKSYVAGRRRYTATLASDCDIAWLQADTFAEANNLAQAECDRRNALQRKKRR